METIGLRGQFDTSDFSKGLSAYLSGLGQATGATQKASQGISGFGTSARSMASGLSSSSGLLGSFASGLGGIATVAAGMVTANLFGALASGVKSFAAAGLEAVGNAQQLEVGLGALLTMNNLYEKTSTTMQVATMSAQEWTEAQADAATKADDLAFKQRQLTADINTQNASIQEQKQRIIQMAEGLDKNQQVARLAEMELALEGMHRELAQAGEEQGKLNNLTREYTTVTKDSFETVMGFADAQSLAKKQSQELLAFVDKLSITSPFEQEQVQLVTKFAVAADMGVEQTKAFTTGFLDLAAAVGIGSEGLAFAADQLLQVKKIGQINQIDLRQLRRIGIDLEKIIGVEMGMSIDQFNEKAKQSPEIFDDLFKSVTTFSEKTFKGASSALATSVGGLQSTISDIFRVGAKNLMRPIIEAVSPSISEILGRISNVVTGPQMAAIGANIPKVLFGAFSSITGGGEGGLFSGLKGMGLDSSTAKSITDITQGISGLVLEVRSLIAAFQMGGFAGLGAALGIPPEVITGIQSFVTEAERLKDVFMGGFETGGLQGGIMALFGDIQPQLENLAGQFLEGIPTFLTTLTTGLTDHFRNNVPVFQEALAEWGPMFWDGLKTALLAAGAAAGSIGLAIAAWAMNPDTQQQLMAAGNEIGKTIFTGLKLLFENADEASNLMMTVSGVLAAATVGVASLLIGVGAQIVAGIMQGLLDSLGIDLQPATISELGGILSQMGSDLAIIAQHAGTALMEGMVGGIRDAGRNLKTAAETALKTLNPVFAGLWGLLSPHFEDTFKNLGDYFSGDKWAELGISAMEGLLQGMKESAGEVLEFLKELAADSLAGLGQFWGAESPAKKFVPLGQSVPQGVALGIQNASSLVNQAVQGLATAGWSDMKRKLFDLIDDYQDAGKYMRLGFGQTTGEAIKHAFKKAFNQSFEGIMAGTVTAEQLKALTQHFAGAYAERVQGSFNTIIEKTRQEGLKMILQIKNDLMDALPGLASNLSGIAGEFAGMLTEQIGSLDEARKKVEQLTQATGKNAEAVAKNKAELEGLQSTRAGTIALLENFLKGKDDQFKFAYAPNLVGVDSVMMSRVEAQEQLNMLLREQEEQERLITEQKENQQKLTKLQAQIDLIKAGRELGVGNLFEGIAFGLNASEADLLEATNRLINAMIGQITTTLEIHSPSGLMERLFGYVPAGAAQGILKGTGLVQRAIGQMSGAMSGASMTSIYNSTQQNFNINLPSGGGSTPAYQGLQMKQAIRYQLAGV